MKAGASASPVFFCRSPPVDAGLEGGGGGVRIIVPTPET